MSKMPPMTLIIPTREEMVVAIRKHAMANYEKDGWDYVVESYSDPEIIKILDEHKPYTIAGAIAVMHREVKLVKECADIRRTEGPY